AGRIRSAEKILAENKKVRESLEEINIDSIDAILLRQIWTTGFIADHFNNFGTQTMDNPRLHYLAGKCFFLGGRLQHNFLLGPEPAMYYEDFLLAKKYPGWQDHAFTIEEFQKLLMSTKNLMSGSFLPAAYGLKLKAHLNDPAAFPLSADDRKSARVELIPLITGKSDGAKDWAAAGLEGASYRKKAQAMLNHIGRFRNWVVPYPIDGFKAVLAEGAVKGADAHEKNWCALQLAMILLEEKADKKLVQQVLAGTVKGSDGEVALEDGDTWLMESIKTRFAGY
ncbi:MAG: hypothetical protein ABIJ56_20615, partial [Pseudomonadota bacterium]